MEHNDFASLITGTILGDSYLTPTTKRRKTSQLRLKLMGKSKGYLEWMKEELDNYSLSSDIRLRKTGQVELISEPSVLLGEFRKLFYPEGIKIVPKCIDKLLNTRKGVAIWYMEDGSLDFRPGSHYSMSLATNSFSYDENVLLRQTLKENFGVETTIRHRPSRKTNEQYNLYTPSLNVRRFAEVVSPYIHPVFSYKNFVERYDNLPKEMRRKSYYEASSRGNT